MVACLLARVRVLTTAQHVRDVKIGLVKWSQCIKLKFKFKIIIKIIVGYSYFYLFMCLYIFDIPLKIVSRTVYEGCKVFYLQFKVSKSIEPI